VKTWDNAFYVFFTFLTWHFKKTLKVAFLDFEKNAKKRILELWSQTDGISLAKGGTAIKCIGDREQKWLGPTADR